MVTDIYDARVQILGAIRDLLFDMADGDMDSVDTELLRDYFGKLANHIVESIGLEVTGVDEGVVTATLSLPSAG